MSITNGSRLWTCSAAAAAAEQILNAGQLGKPPSTYPSAIACPPADDDLYRLVLGEEPRKKASLAGHAAGPHAVNGPVAVVYGDDYIDPLLPFIARAFNSMTVIDSNQEPTFGRNVMVNDSDWVVLACGKTGSNGFTWTWKPFTPLQTNRCRAWPSETSPLTGPRR
jgi:hypothetical protein